MRQQFVLHHWGAETQVANMAFCYAGSRIYPDQHIANQLQFLLTDHGIPPHGQALNVRYNAMKKYPASEKLNKTEFNSYEDWQTYPAADYTCENCKQVVSIDFKSLTKHQFSDFSNFTENDKKAFQTYADSNDLTKTNS